MCKERCTYHYYTSSMCFVYLDNLSHLNIDLQLV